MTSFENSNSFLLGMAILAKYRNDDFSINVVERSAIAVEGLKLISDLDLEDLALFGWDASNSKDKAFATYYNLEYVDY